ncbi:hypothetical protein [Methanoregula sp. UBA64]|uniref:hypothetical protein n=1 Tax=Methanoregula sp. UBA64 TaxID=1915554 RepID=UPI0025CDA224|nr:hypothetical protein [Methanoregula sp. UBA64]
MTARQAVHRGYAFNFLSDATGTLAVSNAARVGDGRGTAPGDPRDASQMRFARVMGTEEWVKEK